MDNDNKIKIYKKDGIPIKIEINGQELKGISKIEIKNYYTADNFNESVIVEITNISFLEIITN